VIISTILIHFYGWTGFDPIASLFIAILIAASVVPLVIDTGRILALDVSEKDATIEAALKEVGGIPKILTRVCNSLFVTSWGQSKVSLRLHTLDSGQRMRPA